jgi:hypothetical protein
MFEDQSFFHLVPQVLRGANVVEMTVGFEGVTLEVLRQMVILAVLVGFPHGIGKPAGQ